MGEIAFLSGRPQGLTQVRQISATLAESSGMVRASFPSSASFSPLAYLPQAAGIATARQLGGGVFEQLIAGRMLNVWVYLALMAAAAWVVPCGRRLLVLFARPPRRCIWRPLSVPTRSTLRYRPCSLPGASGCALMRQAV